MKAVQNNDTSARLTIKVRKREKEAWRKAARRVGEGLRAFTRTAVRQRIQALQLKTDSPWDDLLGSVSTKAPPATNTGLESLFMQFLQRFRPYGVCGFTGPGSAY